MGDGGPVRVVASRDGVGVSTEEAVEASNSLGKFFDSNLLMLMLIFSSTKWVTLGCTHVLPRS